MIGCIENALTFTEQFATPSVGMGATLVLFTDRQAHTVVAVSKSGKTVTLQRDTARRTDAHGMSECQQYAFTRNPEAPRVQARLTPRGWIARRGFKVLVGVRAEYHDYSF